MATSSILRNVHIKDKDAARRFVCALEQAKEKPHTEVKMSKKVVRLTKEQVQAIFDQ